MMTGSGTRYNHSWGIQISEPGFGTGPTASTTQWYDTREQAIADAKRRIELRYGGYEVSHFAGDIAAALDTGDDVQTLQDYSASAPGDRICLVYPLDELDE